MKHENTVSGVSRCFMEDIHFPEALNQITGGRIIEVEQAFDVFDSFTGAFTGAFTVSFIVSFIVSPSDEIVVSSRYMVIIRQSSCQGLWILPNRLAAMPL